jgi:protein-tyrosine phosphatase
MDLVPLDEQGQLFISPSIDDWKAIEDHSITAVIDLDGDVDFGIPNIPNHMLYVYFPICDDCLPDLNKLHALANLGARLVANGEKLLVHCGLGFNRSALVAGLVLTYLGMKGQDAVARLRERRPGALFNENFAAYLTTLPPNTIAPGPS